jgi:hypothetical protein
MSDAKYADWLRENSKPCPQCRVPIEKDGGCDHMVIFIHSICHYFIMSSMACAVGGMIQTCGSCNYEFCWESGKAYNEDED